MKSKFNKIKYKNFLTKTRKSNETVAFSPIKNSNFRIQDSGFGIHYSGFTLIELIVAISGFALVGAGIIALVSNVLLSSNQQGGLLSDSDQARRLSAQIMQELRNSVNSSTGAYPIDTAADQSLIFYSNIDGGIDIERVRYYVQNGKLYKGVLKPTGNPLVYNVANEASVAVQSNIANASAPLFYYYDGTYTGNTENFLSQPVNVTNVRFVKLSIKIYNKAGVKNTNTYTISASGSVRNLKDNLGN